MAEPISDQDLRLLRSGEVSIAREVELFKRIANDPLLQSRFEAAAPYSTEERQAHIARILGRQPHAPTSEPEVPTKLRHSWSGLLARIRQALEELLPAPADRRLDYGWRDADAGSGEQEVVFLSEDLEFDGRSAGVTASAVLQPDRKGQNRLLLRVSVVDLESADVLPDVLVHLECPLLTGGSARTDQDGVAEFRVVTGGHWLREAAPHEDEFVITLAR